jgi:diadenylate cyclase
VNNLATLLADFRLNDAFDILIVATGMYYLLLLIREVRAFRVIAGFSLLLLCSAVAKHLHLLTFEWLLTNLWTVLLIAFVLVFQPDLRRLLSQMGGARFFGGVLAAEEPLFKEIVRAVKGLARARHGALIVLERGDNLQAIIDTGVRMEAAVTAELLITLFTPRSPLHDGAVVIRNGRLAAAGCILPLSQNPNVSKAYGTRHRAGLGLTEETDALVVVVSEETKSISFAMAGKITPQIDAETLEEMLTLYGARIAA